MIQNGYSGVSIWTHIGYSLMRGARAARELIHQVQAVEGVAGVADSALQTGRVGREPDHHEMDVLRAQWFLPVLGSVLPHVPKLGRACGHAPLKLGREAGE